jgi:hypothetical protein
MQEFFFIFDVSRQEYGECFTSKDKYIPKGDIFYRVGYSFYTVNNPGDG